MNSKDKKSVISFFENLQLPEDQMAVIRDYIARKAGDEALEKLDFKDLTSFPYDKSYSLAMFSFVHRKLYDEARMFFKILFALSEEAIATTRLTTINQSRLRIYRQDILAR